MSVPSMGALRQQAGVFARTQNAIAALPGRFAAISAAARRRRGKRAALEALPQAVLRDIGMTRMEMDLIVPLCGSQNQPHS